MLSRPSARPGGCRPRAGRCGGFALPGRTFWWAALHAPAVHCSTGSPAPVLADAAGSPASTALCRHAACHSAARRAPWLLAVQQPASSWPPLHCCRRCRRLLCSTLRRRCCRPPRRRGSSAWPRFVPAAPAALPLLPPPLRPAPPAPAAAPWTPLSAPVRCWRLSQFSIYHRATAFITCSGHGQGAC